MNTGIISKSTHISELYGKGSPVFSLEFFPPKASDGLEKTCVVISECASLPASFMTVTYGAGGGTRELSSKIIDFILSKLNRLAVAHITCRDHSKDSVLNVIRDLKAKGVRNILALRGDGVNGQSFIPHPEGFSCARDLVTALSGDKDLCLSVAGYPEIHKDAVTPEDDIRYLKEKVAAGAKVIFTQLFFDAEYYFSFVRKARAVGITEPIVPGIMPIRDVAQLERFTSLCGATIPHELREELQSIRHNKDAVTEFGIEFGFKLAKGLLEGGAPGIHFYTLNKAYQVQEIVRRLVSATTSFTR